MMTDRYERHGGSVIDTQEGKRVLSAATIVKRLNETEAAQWISVEDRLPSEMAEVDVFIKGPKWTRGERVADAWVDCGNWFIATDGDEIEDVKYVTHWRPLPEPPAADE